MKAILGNYLSMKQSALDLQTIFRDNTGLEKITFNYYIEEDDHQMHMRIEEFGINEIVYVFGEEGNPAENWDFLEQIEDPILDKGTISKIEDHIISLLMDNDESSESMYVELIRDEVLGTRLEPDPRLVFTEEESEFLVDMFNGKFHENEQTDQFLDKLEVKIRKHTITG